MAPLSAPAVIRPATGADSRACFAIFRHSLADAPWAKLDRYLPSNPCLWL